MEKDNEWKIQLNVMAVTNENYDGKRKTEKDTVKEKRLSRCVEDELTLSRLLLLSPNSHLLKEQNFEPSSPS